MKKIVLLITLFLIACDNGGSDKPIPDFSGTWSGSVNAKITSGDPLCSYFGGEYPIEWNFVKVTEREYKVIRGEFELATAIIQSDNETARMDFLELQNVIPDPNLNINCFGADIITGKINSNGEMELFYDGESECSNIGICHYQGEGKLNKL